MRAVFRDATLQEGFDRSGYVSMPLLWSDDVRELEGYFLKKAARDEVRNSPYGIWMSIYDAGDTAARREAMELIHGVAMPRLKEAFIDCKPTCGTYFVKVPDPKSYTWPHQDWSFVDYEALGDRCSFKVWIALRDVDVDSGTLGFINGSPRFFGRPVGSPSPALVTFTAGHERLLFEYMSYKAVKAGDALVFNNQTIHAAMPNGTTESRIAVGISMAPAEADFVHYFLKPGAADRVLKLKVEEDFFLKCSNRELAGFHAAGVVPGHCTVEGEIEYDFSPVSPAEMARLCEHHGSVRSGRPVNLRG